MYLRSFIAVTLLLSQMPVVPAFAQEAPTPAVTPTGPYEQDFVLTAYYSPLPDQCCYVKGSYEADKILNGEGTHGADGTAVYEGMIAAPPSYPFGTRIVLPGLGTFTVHDRGGAIQEWDDSHRLDVWAGHGEEGLARALAFGVQEIRGTVYLPQMEKPAENASLATLPAPLDRLKPYVTEGAALVEVKPEVGTRGYSVKLLQENLAALGYFNHEATGLYGDVTAAAVKTFNIAMNLTEPFDQLTEKTAAYLQAALNANKTASPVVFVGKESSPSDVKKTQRLLRYLGFYKGRTDGQYSSVLFDAILAYQREQQLVGDATSPGAGRIGPLTKSKLDQEVYRRRIARIAARLLAYNDVQKLLNEKDRLIGSTMSKGSNGPDVRALQEFLADKGFFPQEKINGNFGDLTAQAVAAYQIKRELLKSDQEKGAGTVGPITLKMMQGEQVKKAYTVVRGFGWSAL